MSKRLADQTHLSVLLRESVEILLPKRGGIFIDATLGMGGHSEALLESNKELKVFGIDQDPYAISHAAKRLERFGERFTAVRSNFSDLKDIANGEIDGIVADLGVSSLQFDSEERGFSFRFDADLDMRMDPESDEPTAAELLATLTEEEIANVIYQYGEERASRKIARWIVERRTKGDPITKTGDLAALVERAVRRGSKDKIHPATRTFQALRIAVNKELEVLENFLVDAVEILKIEGRLAVITFHSLEDRIVKHAFQKMSGKCFCPPRMPICVCGAENKVEILTRKPMLPTEEESNENPRSRSAKLRAIKKIK